MHSPVMVKQGPGHRNYHRLFAPSLLFVGLALTSLALLVLQSWLNDTPLEALANPLEWLASLNLEAAFDILSSAAEVVAAVLAIAITVVAIVVELAANRYSHEITRLFLREPVNLVVLGIFVLTTVQCVWIAAVLGESGGQAMLPQAGFAITLGLATLCLLILVPYIYFVFTFLQPISVIERICREAYHIVLKARSGNIDHCQDRVEGTIDELQDVARSAIQQGDRGIAMAAVNAMAGFLSDYINIRAQLPEHWFDVTSQIAEDPDFIALAPESMAEVRTQGIWLERKIFRRYLSLMGQSAIHAQDVANLIGINTQRIATSLGPDNPHLLELCMRSFNSYLRTAINARDLRTAYYLLNQYRIVAETLLRTNQAHKALEIANYLKDYGQLAHNVGFSFLLETAAYDVMQLVEQALDSDSLMVDGLLDCLLQLDQEIKEESQEDSLLGVRRAQIQVATLFIAMGDTARVDRIVEDLRGEQLERLERLRLGLLSDDRAQFWELMDRGVNFAYLQEERRPHLEVLFAMLRSTD